MASTDWGASPWGDTPFVWGTSVDPPGAEDPSSAVAVLKEIGLRGPGDLVHEFIGSNGAARPEIVQGFECIEEAPGGYVSASGHIAATDALDQPHVYEDGAQWRVSDRASGREVFVGFLQDPAISHGKAQLRADGTGRDPERTFGRIPFQVRKYSMWSSGAGDPYTMVRPDGSPLNDDKIKIDTAGGHVLFTVDEGTVVVNGDRNRTVLWTPGELGNHPTRLAFTAKNSVATVKWDLHIHTGKGPTGAITQRNTMGLNFTNSAVDMDISSPANDDLIAITLQASDSFTSVGFTTELTNLRVNYGGLTGDEVTTSQLARDLISRMGFGIDRVAESGFNGLPFDTGSDSRADSLDSLALYTDWRWLAFGEDIEFGPWNTRVWTVIDPELPVDLIPLPRFDQVVIPYQYPNSSAVGEEKVVSPTPLLKSRSFGAVSLPQPAPDREAAQQLGQRLLDYLITKRVAGSATLAEVLDPFGIRQSAHQVHAGDVLDFPLLDARSRIKSLRRTSSGVQVTLDDRLAVLERILARRRHRLELRGLL